MNNICSNCFTILNSTVCAECGYNIGMVKKRKFILKPGSVLNNKYIIGRVLGIGGFGITYLAKSVQSDKRYAIKEYYPSDLVYRDEQTDEIRVNKTHKNVYLRGLESFYKEITILSSLSNCRSIVKVLDYFKANNTVYMVMEWLDGLTVREFMAANFGSLSYNKSFEIMLETGKALKRIHEKGLLHRDVSPGNIFITKNGDIKLIDFGAARYFVGANSKGLSVILKPGFAPPEQYSSKSNQGPWTDIYALASTFYLMSSGKMIPEAIERLNGKEITKLSTMVPAVPKHVAKAIEKALSINLKDRYLNMFEFLGEITDDGAKTRPPSIAKPQPPKFYMFKKLWKKIQLWISEIKKNVNKDKSTPELSIMPVIVMISGPMSGREWSMPADVPMKLGRTSSKCDIIIPTSSKISGEHLTLYYDNKSKVFYIRDYSLNGTYYKDGRRFAKGEKVKIAPGTVFYAAAPEFKFKVELRYV